jgi:hypothetical protein
MRCGKSPKGTFSATSSYPRVLAVRLFLSSVILSVAVFQA